MNGAQTPTVVQWYLFGLLFVAQLVAGIVSIYVTYILPPQVQETFTSGPALLAAAAEPLVVPVGLAVAAYLLVRRFGIPSFEPRHFLVLFGFSFLGFYLGFWVLGLTTPTPGRIPLEGRLAFWNLLEMSEYLPYAWSVFLLPGIEGGVATLAGAGAASLQSRQ